MPPEVAPLPLITNDAVVLGILFIILAAVFVTSQSERPFWKRFYGYVPALLLCYFIPSLFSTAGIFSGDVSRLYFVASQYLLPASLVLLTVSIDLRSIMRLGPKAVIMFLGGTAGVMIGGPVAVLLISYFNPALVGGVGPDAVWRGLATIAGSWIGGGANQTAMKEIFGVSDNLFSALIAVDVLVANVWMACLLFAAARAKRIDAWLGADTSAIAVVKQKVEELQARSARIPSLTDLMVLLAVGFGITALGHVIADVVAPFIEARAPQLEQFSLTSKFFWIVVVATTAGLILSAWPRARALEGVGASRIGSAFLYVLVATIGMKMNLLAIFAQPGLFLIGAVWMLVHITIMLTLAYFIKAPVFFVAVGSQANIGGAASAPVVASAFHPALAPVGVLLAVLGYALGTYGAWICAMLMRAAAPM
ncbi:MAG: DUF819 family protein [Chthoniobacterales bacterium]|nr:DUF819 family protein [Chthoniobacterales bacterium]